MGSDDNDNNSMNEDESSDVELTGVEMDDEEMEEIDDDDDAAVVLEAPAGAAAAASLGSSNDDERMTALLSAEAQEMEEAKKERAELMTAELAADVAPAEGQEQHANQAAATPQQRLEYLIAQSEVFAHFLAGALHESRQRKRRNLCRD
jgi:hypothetical protein